MVNNLSMFDTLQTELALFDIILSRHSIFDENNIEFADFSISTCGYSFVSFENKLFLMTNTLENVDLCIAKMLVNIPDKLYIFIRTYDKNGALVDDKKAFGKYINRYPFNNGSSSRASWTVLFELEDLK